MADERHGTGHVRHTVVNHTVHYIGGLGVSGGTACFEAAALVNRNVDEDRTALHTLYHGG